MLIKPDKHSHVTFELQCVQWHFIAHIAVQLLTIMHLKTCRKCSTLLFMLEL